MEPAWRLVRMRRLKAPIRFMEYTLPSLDAARMVPRGRMVGSLISV
jgi:hypothetical protein